MRRPSWLTTLSGALLVAPLLALGTSLAPPAVSAANCAPAGSTGLSAKIVATAGQHIGGRIDAAGCQVGVYVGPGIDGVVIAHAQISGAADHAIFAQDADHLLVEASTISGNGGHPTAGIPDDKAVQLVGTHAAIVRGNVVRANADGGIGVNDDGPIDPAAPDPGTLRAAVGNTISRNIIVENFKACGVVVAAFNSGAGVERTIVIDNTVTNGKPGAIVIAADTPDSSVSDNVVMGNTITNNLLPGVIVHSNAPGDTVAGTLVLDNTISGNGPDPEAAGKAGPTKPTGILLAGEVAPVTGSFVIGNRISHEYFGIWESNARGTVLILRGLDHATVPVHA